MKVKHQRMLVFPAIIGLALSVFMLRLWQLQVAPTLSSAPRVAANRHAPKSDLLARVQRKIAKIFR